MAEMPAMRRLMIAPSILSADFARLGEELRAVERAGADCIHIDVMDGVFVPNISFGFPVMNALRGVCHKPTDVHLMIVEPQKFIREVADSGAYMMTVHYEACTHLHRTVHAIRDAGMRVGVALNPHTPVTLLEDILGDLDMVLLMSVNPGFAAQSFIGHSVVKTAKLRRMIRERELKTLIEVDGGVTGLNVVQLDEAGVDIVVAGSYVFRSPDPEATIRELKAL